MKWLGSTVVAHHSHDGCRASRLASRDCEPTHSLTDNGAPPHPNESALFKVMVIQNAVRAVDIAASLAGNRAHARANPIERHIRDVRSGRVQAPQADAAFVSAGRAAICVMIRQLKCPTRRPAPNGATCAPAQFPGGKKTSARTSMLSRGGAPTASGFSNDVWKESRARPSSALSWTRMRMTSSRCCSAK
jgi:hypothetical protein